MAHDKGSFDYKVIHPNITKVLDTRSQLDNTVQLAMPFVKATTTIQHKFLGTGCIGFTLGLHAIDEDVKYEDIYSDVKSSPLIGYTYQEDGSTKRVYAFNPLEEVGNIAAQIFDRNANLYNSTSFVRIPPPGITNVTISRNKNGLLASATLEIMVPSLIQLESLHRTFLVPGIGMVLEWGQQFAQEKAIADYSEKPNISDYMFPWHKRDELKTLLTRLGDKTVGLEEILEKYVYPSEGQYMWMFGRVANFSIKSNSDGSSTCTVKIVGPSEDSWAYSTLNTVVPAKSTDPSVKYYCADTTSVYSYFSSTTTGTNLKSLLDNIDSKVPQWKNHVQKFDHTLKVQEPTTNDTNPNYSEKTFADAEDSYFMTWRFFVNVVLNDKQHGLLSIFNKATPDEINKIGLLLPYADGDNRTITNIANLNTINDPMESYVGYNEFLRSVDPSVMIIVNETAAKLAEQNPQYNIPGSKTNLLRATPQSDKFLKTGTFGAGIDRGFLSTGVWINHKAVVEAFISADTVLRGISNLLDRMNRATQEYWELTIDVGDPYIKNPHPHNYMVVDAKFRESSENAVNRFIDRVHIFNKYTRVTDDGKLVGSDLINCELDLSLPKRLFSQIATLGLVQPGDMQKFAPQVSVEDRLSMLENSKKKSELEQKTPKLTPNDTLREMFAITSLTQDIDVNGYGPDLTIPPKVLRKEAIQANGVCGKANTQLTAQVGGQGNMAAGIALNQVSIDNNAELTSIKASVEGWLEANKDICIKCDQVEQATHKFTNLPPLTIEQVKADVAAFKKYIDARPDLIKKQSNEFEITENKILTNTPVGTHMDNSAHYVNQAIDIPVHSPENANAVLTFWKTIAAGKDGYEVIDEYNNPPGNHIHLEWNQINDPATTTPPVTLTDAEKLKCKECATRKEALRQVDMKIAEKVTPVENKIREFYGLQNIFRYVEIFPEYMVAHITDTANGNFANAFGASPGTLSISADLIMPGINGLRIGELFWVDRVPAFYKAFGAFQIITIEDTITPDGWKTSVNARFNYLGKSWKDAMALKLSGANK